MRRPLSPGVKVCSTEDGAEDEEEEKGVMLCGEHWRFGLWPPTMASLSSRGEAGEAPGDECARVALTAALYARAANDRGCGGRAVRHRGTRGRRLGARRPP